MKKSSVNNLINNLKKDQDQDEKLAGFEEFKESIFRQIANALELPAELIEQEVKKEKERRSAKEKIHDDSRIR